MSEERSKNSERRRLLVVTYDYPPVTSAGMYRMAGMTKYLGRFGWDITVLTVKKSFVYSTSGSLELIPKDVRVIRTPSVEIRRIGRSLADAIRGGAPSVGGFRKTLAVLVSRVFSVIERLTTFPDAKAGWMPFLFFRLWGLINNGSYDVVLSSSPPHSLHLPVLLLRSFKRFHWVTDFRDPWTIPSREATRDFGYHAWRKLEKKILFACDAVVANTTGNCAALVAQFGEYIDKKTKTITNGFDREHVPVASDLANEASNFDFVYMGHVYPGMLDIYVRALRHMREQKNDKIPRLCIFGRVPGKQELPVDIGEDLEGLIEFKPRVPFQESLGIIENAKNLLLLVPHGPGFETWAPSKLYPYLFSTTPILVIGPDGDASHIVTTTGRGIGITSPDASVVADRIDEFLRSADSGTLNIKTNSGELEKYSMRHISNEMDLVLRRVVEE